jgi:hypothetical protein
LAISSSFDCHSRTLYHPSGVSWGSERVVSTMTMVHCGQLGAGYPGSCSMIKPLWLNGLLYVLLELLDDLCFYVVIGTFDKLLG